MTKNKVNNDHVIIDGENKAFVCKLCGMGKGIKLPCDIKELAIAAKVFTKDHRKCALKNCYTCEHLEWGEGDTDDPSGFTCWKRQDGMNETQERFLLKNLEKEAYLRRWKPCYEKKGF